jgi:hypothetical protein
MAFTTNSVKAQVTLPELNVAVGNLVNVQGVDVSVILQDIQITDVIDVSNVLNNNDVDLSILRTITIDNVLNNTLRDANFLNDNQVVVGLVVNLLGGVEQVLVANKKAARK